MTIDWSPPREVPQRRGTSLPGPSDGTHDWTGRGVRLRDADPLLAATVPDEAREHIILPAVTLQPGPWRTQTLDQAPGVTGPIHGFLVLSGAVTADLAIGGFRCARLITKSEMMLLHDVEIHSLPVHSSLTAIGQTRLAVLDRRLSRIAGQWPDLMIAVLERAAAQAHQGLLQQAIGQIPSAEGRLLAVMWSVADRLGHVRADGIWCELPVSEETLGAMIGARPPARRQAGPPSPCRHRDSDATWRVLPTLARIAAQILLARSRTCLGA